MVIWSSPAWPRRSSSLPSALTENGQVGSRNISRTRGPWPQTSGSARHVFFIRSFLLRLVHKRRRPEGGQALRPEKPRRPERGDNDIGFNIPPVWHQRFLLDHWSPQSRGCAGIDPAAELFRCTNAGQFLERLVKRCIQQVETEIDF